MELKFFTDFYKALRLEINFNRDNMIDYDEENDELADEEEEDNEDNEIFIKKSISQIKNIMYPRTIYYSKDSQEEIVEAVEGK